MAINLVQYVEADAVVSTSSATLTLTFASPVTAGNTILVLGGANPNNMFPGTENFSVTDSVGDSVTTILFNGAPKNSGPVVFAYLIPVTAGGSSLTVSVAVTITAAIGGISYPCMAVAIEMTGMPGVAVQSENSVNIFGSQGNTPVSTNVTDTLGNTVTVTFNGTAGSGGPGTISTVTAIDLFAVGVNFLFGFVLDQSGTNVPTANHGYSFVLTEAISAPTAGMSLNFFTPGLPLATVAQPQIFVVN